MKSRRQLFRAGASIAAATAVASVSKVAMAALPEIVSQDSPETMSPLEPSTGRPYMNVFKYMYT